MRTRDVILLLAGCFLLGALADFFINGVVIGRLLRIRFTEQLAFVYVPFLFAAAMVLSKKILRTKFSDEHTRAVCVFAMGALLGHSVLVGLSYNRRYSMNFDLQFNGDQKTFLLRSPEWSQILFVTSEKAQAELLKNHEHRPVPVEIAVVSNYGCDASAVVSTVAGVDVREDAGATWTWQVDRSAGPALETSGPNSEDRLFFWCWHPPNDKDEVHAPPRPWEVHPTEASPPK